MTMIKPLNTAVDYVIKKPIRKLCDSKLTKYVSGKYNASASEKMKFVTGLSIGSIVLKDGFGCYLYVKQSLANKKIPEDKRKFVAALDLSNGVLMILFQLAMAATISNKKVQSKMFNAAFGKYFERAPKKSLEAVITNNGEVAGIAGSKFHNVFTKYKEEVAAGFESVTTLAAATIIGKRVLVPFIATPLADKAKAWMSKGDKPAVIHPDTKNTYDTKSTAHNKGVEPKVATIADAKTPASIEAKNVTTETEQVQASLPNSIDNSHETNLLKQISVK